LLLKKGHEIEALDPGKKALGPAKKALGMFAGTD
jgi:hypothetical protein